MPVPSLITRDGQYEFNGLLLNDSLSDLDTLRVEKVSGLFDLPDTKVTESELQDDHGGQIGREVFAMKRIFMDIAVISSTAANLYNKVREIEDKFQPSSTSIPLFFRRAGIGTLFIPVRPRKLGGFDTGFMMDNGFVRGSVMLVAPDPRKFSTTDNADVITIASGGTTVGQTVTTVGNFVGGARPILEIDGPVTNPRIANAGDGGRTIRIDMVITAGQKLIINTATRSITLSGVDQSLNVRPDNQWWVLNRGANLITFTRSNSPANTGVLTVKWNEAYA